jgi:hypothetical protein
MHARPFRSPFRPPKSQPPPLWFVTNGATTVGPVRTDLLVRGVTHHKIPNDCLVRELRWKSWRRLEQVRELRPILMEPARPSAGWLAQAADSAEVLLLALHTAVMLTGATAGICYRARGSDGRPTVSYTHGAAGHELLGLMPPERDPSIALAHVGHGTIGEPDAGAVEMAIFDRLGAAALAGVAMFPVTHRSDLLAVFELARSDHPFRARDSEIFDAITQATLARLIALG